MKFKHECANCGKRFRSTGGYDRHQKSLPNLYENKNKRSNKCD
jgi:hypothetical protein